jgi:hypothetical protein
MRSIATEVRSIVKAHCGTVGLMCARAQLLAVEHRCADSAATGGSALECTYAVLDRSKRDQNSRKLQQKQKHPNSILILFYFALFF